MISSNIDMSMFIAILPEILLLVVSVSIFVLDLVLPDEKKHVLGWVTASGLTFAILVSLLVAQPGTEGQLVWGNMLRFDWMGFVFKMMFLFAAAITAL